MEENKKYKQQQVSQARLDIIGTVRCAAEVLDDYIEVYCPDGKEKALALTKLEECMMWANKSITHQDN